MLEAGDCKSSLVAIDSSLPFEIETDALEHAIAAPLTQNGRPVAFFSRTLTSAFKDPNFCTHRLKW